jgi:lactate dehydrogenase-like 2-hydroxyacid dehydrogenase
MTDKPTVFVTRHIPEAGLRIVRDACAMDLWEGDMPPPRKILLEKVVGCDGLLCLLTEKIDAEIMDAGKSLRVISQMAVGVDNIDLTAAAARGIPVGHTPGVLTDATADLTFALLMTAARRIPEGIEYIRAEKWKTWDPLALLGARVWGSTLGIIGLGRIGTAVARRARGFDMKILYTDRSRKPKLEAELDAIYVSLEELLSRADFVSLHCPLTPETTHLIDAEALQQMKPTAILINAARGPVVHTDALLQALKEGWIERAALDVTDPEPLPADHPLVDQPNCIVVPHVGSATVAARERMAIIAAENLLAGLRGGKLPHCANCESSEFRNSLHSAGNVK